MLKKYCAECWARVNPEDWPRIVPEGLTCVRMAGPLSQMLAHCVGKVWDRVYVNRDAALDKAFCGACSAKYDWARIWQRDPPAGNVRYEASKRSGTSAASLRPPSEAEIIHDYHHRISIVVIIIVISILHFDAVGSSSPSGMYDTSPCWRHPFGGAPQRHLLFKATASGKTLQRMMGLLLGRQMLLN